MHSTSAIDSNVNFRGPHQAHECLALACIESVDASDQYTDHDMWDVIKSLLQRRVDERRVT